MRILRLLACVFSVSVSVTAAFAASSKAPTGLWLTDNKRSAIELYQCKKGEPLLCGKIAWIIDGGMQFDNKNPDASQHNKKLCGMNILRGLRMDGPGEWTDGKIYKADEGDMYDADMEVLSDNQVKLRGYMGMTILGKSQTWTRVSSKDYPRCE